jgi:hypothetical protein
MNNNQFHEVEAEFLENDDIPEFPQFNIACINCNSLNMATVSKNIRMRKFYGIVSLKTEIIFLSDFRLCNKSGVSDFAFANKILLQLIRMGRIPLCITQELTVEVWAY